MDAVLALAVVVVPCFGVGGRAARVLASLPRGLMGAVAVDDGSAPPLDPAVAAVGPGFCEVVRHAENQGVGAAIATGYRWALRQGARYAIVMAGDGQMDPGDLPALCGALGDGAGYVKGSRTLAGRPPGMPALRYLGARVLAPPTRVLAGLSTLSDPQCGYTGITRDAMAWLIREGFYARYGYPNEVVVKLARAGFTVAEVPVRAIYGGEPSGIRPLRIIPHMSWRLGALARWVVKTRMQS